MMEHAVNLTIPLSWLQGRTVSQDELRQALTIGLTQLRQQQATPDTTKQVIQALLSTGRIRHLSTALVKSERSNADRQTPPTLPGPLVSEMLIAQRRGEL